MMLQISPYLKNDLVKHGLKQLMILALIGNFFEVVSGDFGNLVDLITEAFS
jgi:hypothetical protein